MNPPSASTSRAEVWAWLFMRGSGVLLILLTLAHLVIMHLVDDVGTIDYTFVAIRFEKPFWRIYDLLLLLLALLHGMNGLRTIIDDFLKRRARVAALAALYFVWTGFAALGTWAIIGFQPREGVSPQSEAGVSVLSRLARKPCPSFISGWRNKIDSLNFLHRPSRSEEFK